tara:strand:+ start:288 stop:464 length:177 start_codon:yes stop_codon:yes gene_type:complete
MIIMLSCNTEYEMLYFEENDRFLIGIVIDKFSDIGMKLWSYIRTTTESSSDIFDTIKL